MKITHLLITAGLLFSFLLLPSCLDDDGSNWNKLYPNALVTVNTQAMKLCFSSWTIKPLCCP